MQMSMQRMLQQLIENIVHNIDDDVHDVNDHCSLTNHYKFVSISYERTIVDVHVYNIVANERRVAIFDGDLLLLSLMWLIIVMMVRHCLFVVGNGLCVYNQYPWCDNMSQWHSDAPRHLQRHPFQFFPLGVCASLQIMTFVTRARLISFGCDDDSYTHRERGLTRVSCRLTHNAFRRKSAAK